MPLTRSPFAWSASKLAAFLIALTTLFCAFGGIAHALEPVKISREDTALDLTATTEIYSGRSEAFQVSTAPGADGIVRRIEVRSSTENHQGDWAVFALANVSGEQLDRVIVAPHFRLVNSKLFWPDLGSQRMLSITPSEGFALERLPSDDSDVFQITLNPGAVITFVAELATPELPQIYLWQPDAYKDTVNAFTLYRGIVLGIAGLLAVFLTILFVVKGTSMLPATAALAWAVLAYICVDFGFLVQAHQRHGRRRANMASGHRGVPRGRPRDLPLHLSQPQSLAPASGLCDARLDPRPWPALRRCGL